MIFAENLCLRMTRASAYWSRHSDLLAPSQPHLWSQEADDACLTGNGDADLADVDELVVQRRLPAELAP